MGSLLTALAAALGPVVSQLGDQLGITVAIYRPVQATAADGSPTRTYPQPDPAWDGAVAFFSPGSTSNGQPTEAMAKPFGVRTTAYGTLLFVQDAAGQLPTISPFDGFKILSGPYAGYTWLAEADHVPDELGATGTVRVIAAPPGTIA